MSDIPHSVEQVNPDRPDYLTMWVYQGDLKQVSPFTAHIEVFRDFDRLWTEIRDTFDEMDRTALYEKWQLWFGQADPDKNDGT